MSRELCVRTINLLLWFGVQSSQTPWGVTHQEYSKKLLSMFLAGHPNHQLVFMRIWQINKEYLTTAFREYYADNALQITRILDIAQDIKARSL